MKDVTYRDLAGMDEFRAAEALQREVWGEGDAPDPADLMMVIQAEGGLVGGAFSGGKLVGYIFGFPTREVHVQHSHRLAVLAETRGTGVGVGLKLYQRDWCLSRGITHVRWTFDPLRTVNATLNIHRLGARSNTYLEDFYGEMAGINSGMVSDRLLVDWDLASASVAARSSGDYAPPLDARALAVPLPEDIERLAVTDPLQAKEIRLALRTALQSAFAEGHQIVGFDRLSRVYLLSESTKSGGQPPLKL